MNCVICEPRFTPFFFPPEIMEWRLKLCLYSCDIGVGAVVSAASSRSCLCLTILEIQPPLVACTGAVLLSLWKLLAEPSLGLPSCQITLLTIFWAEWTSSASTSSHKSHSVALVLYPPSFHTSAAVGDVKPESGFQVLLHQHWWEADKFPWSAGHTFNGATYAVCCACGGSMLLAHIQPDVHATPRSFSGCSSAP